MLTPRQTRLPMLLFLTFRRPHHPTFLLTKHLFPMNLTHTHHQTPLYDYFSPSYLGATSIFFFSPPSFFQ